MRKPCLLSTLVASRPLAPLALGVTLGLAPLLGCFTTHSIAPDQLPAALQAAPGEDRRRVVKGDDGKPTELPSPKHLRLVEIRGNGVADEIAAPVTAKISGNTLQVEGEGGPRTYRLSNIALVRLRHDDHKADMIGGTVMLSAGVLTLLGASAAVIYDFTQPEPHCEDPYCGRGYIAALIGVPIGALGLSIAIPGVVLTARGVRGLGAPPLESASPVPRVSVGPGSAVVTVPF